MATQSIIGMWKLVDVTNSAVSGQKFDTVLHFVDDRYFYDISQGQVTRHRYRIQPNSNPPELDFGVSLGIYKFENGKLLHHHRMPGKPRPTTFDNAPISVYEYVGEGPTNWKTEYKQQIRKQLEETARRFREESL